jgi:hypothetical protein
MNSHAYSESISWGTYNVNLLTTIHSPETPEIEFLKAVSKLGYVDEPASFWSEIANDSRFKIECRRIAVLQLFSRHVRTPTPLAEIAKLLNHPGWIRNEDIKSITFIGGFVPLKKFADYPLRSGSLIRLSIIGSPDYVYFLIKAKEFSEADFLKALEGKLNTPNPIVWEVGW